MPIILFVGTNVLSCFSPLYTFSELGFLINYEESFLEPCTTREYIGYIVDSVGPNDRP